MGGKRNMVVCSYYFSLYEKYKKICALLLGLVISGCMGSRESKKEGFLVKTIRMQYQGSDEIIIA